MKKVLLICFMAVFLLFSGTAQATQLIYELDYEFLSGGERTAIALAYRLSLNQVINSVLSRLKTGNLIILDEPKRFLILT